MKAPTGSVPDGERPGIAEVIGWRALLRFALVLVLAAAVLFVSAGTLNWPMAWGYVAVYLVLTIIGRALLWRKSPELFKERAGYDTREGVKSWDKRIMPWVAIYGPLLGMIVAGLNRRFGWPPSVPMWLQIAAMVLVVLGTLLGTWAMLANRYFSAVVRIQKERGHTTVATGPYRYVRHPGYAGGILANLASPLALGAAWALVVAAVVVGLTILRTALEDRTLRDELPGYREYSERTRYRLLPGLW